MVNSSFNSTLNVLVHDLEPNTGYDVTLEARVTGSPFPPEKVTINVQTLAVGEITFDLSVPFLYQPRPGTII